jgi:hypothetical protein
VSTVVRAIFGLRVRELFAITGEVVALHFDAVYLVFLILRV